MKLISRHNGRRFAEQNGPEGKERKSHTLLILPHILRFPLTGKLLANKENEGKYHIIDQLTGSKVFQQQEALVSCSLFQNQAGLCCSISTETKKKAFLKPKLYLLSSALERRRTAVISYQREYHLQNRFKSTKLKAPLHLLK